MWRDATRTQEALSMAVIYSLFASCLFLSIVC
jgi:hypothetical protein